MLDRAFVLPLAVSQAHVFHRQETVSCLHRLAHAAARGDLDPDSGDKFVLLDASSHGVSTRVSRTLGRQEPTFVSSDFEPEKHLPDNSTTPFNSIEILVALITQDLRITWLVTKISVSTVPIHIL